MTEANGWQLALAWGPSALRRETGSCVLPRQAGIYGNDACRAVYPLGRIWSNGKS